MGDFEKREPAQTTIDPETFEVLSIVNAVQFFAFLVLGAARAVGITCRILFGTVFHLIDRGAALLAGGLSWIVVFCVSVIFFIMRALLWRVVGTFVFVFYRIPKFLIVTLYRIIQFIVHSFGSVLDECTTAVVTLPSAILDVAYTTRESFVMPAGWGKRMGAFIGVALLFTLPVPAFHSFQFLNDVRASTESISIEGLSLLQQGEQALTRSEFEQASDFFAQSHRHFEEAEKNLSFVPAGVRGAVQYVPFAGRKIGDGQRFIMIGRDVAQAGIIATNSAKKFSEQSADPQKFFTSLPSLIDSVDEVFRLLKNADTLASQIDPSAIPDDYRARFTALSGQLHVLVGAAEQILPARGALLHVLGSGVKRRYLVVFQNNTELRPTGGFIGSYALIDVLNGQLVHTEVPTGGSYDLQGSFHERIQSPLPLHTVNPSWQFQDSNWFPDFPTSAKKIIWFYEKSGGPTVDGVIAFNASFFQRMLRIIGSVNMSSYGKELTADNFFLETQKSVELEYDKKENRPKQFIADLLPKTLEKMSSVDSEKRSALFSEVISAFDQRDIQLYMTDPQEEDVLKHFGVAGEMRASPLDYFSLVQANVGGGKGEGVIDEDVERRTVFTADGHIEVHVTIHRKHKGKIGDPFGGTRNISYVRMYLPGGSKSISASGFSPLESTFFKPALEGYSVDDTLRSVEGLPTLDPASGLILTSEYGRAVFAQWMILEPQQERTAEAVFVLPFTVRDIPLSREGNRVYTLLVQRQSGATTRRFTTIFQSEHVSFMSSTPENSSLKKNSFTHVFDPFVHDEVIGITLHE